MSCITSLQLTNFRSYDHLNIDGLKSGAIALCGANGAGKTNVLEALSLLSPGRGLRNSKIDEIETSFDKITISIPVDISSINPSFLEEFLENVVAKLGESSFYSKFSFVNPGRYKIVDDLSEAVDRILRDTNAIA